MPAGMFTVYAANLPDQRMRDLLTAVVQMALVKSTYTPSADESGHTVWADVAAHEVGAGNGYSAGGAALASKAIAPITLGAKFSSDEIVWTPSGPGLPAWRYAVMYVQGALWGLTDPLIGYFLGNAAPADIPITSTLLRLKCPAAGWFDTVRG